MRPQPARLCRLCQRPFVRQARERLDNYRRRRYCCRAHALRDQLGTLTQHLVSLVPPQTCANPGCTKVVPHRPGESFARWRRRRTCGAAACARALAHAGVLRRFAPTRPPQVLPRVLGWHELFPGATYQRREELPLFCLHCHGLLHPTPTGAQCRSCSRELHVARLLADQLGLTRSLGYAPYRHVYDRSGLDEARLSG